jgi:cyclophilin family peptidyl-prolyl cis-trans isomerase
MFDRSRDGARNAPGASRRGGASGASRRELQPRVEGLEDRQLLSTASLQPIANINVPATLGAQVPLVAGPGAPASQTYTVTSDNPSVQATIAQGPFLTINVSHASSGPGDPAFTGTMVFQLFQDLTPIAVQRISQLVRQGFYNGKVFHRIANMFPGPTDYIVQGGSVNGDGTGNINQPGYPFQDEFTSQLAFTNPYQLALANSGRDTNQSQFFITTDSPQFLDFQYTIFGQLVSGQNVVQEMTQVATSTRNSSGQPMPISPITMTSVTLSNTNPDGVVHINTTQASPGDVAHITVTATDPTNHTTSTQTFTVNVVANTANNGNERAFLAPLADQNPVIGPGQTYTLQLQGDDPEASDQLTYTVQGGITTDQTTGAQSFSPVQNATANVSSTGLVTVTPNAGFTGTIPLLVGVRDQVNRAGVGQPLNSPSNYDYHMLTLHVTNFTENVQVIGNVMVINAPPTPPTGSNTITVDQVNGAIVATINGVADPIQPQATNLDEIVIDGSKGSDKITVAPAVTVPTTIDGGQGGKNVLQAGGGPTVEHGWFGLNTLIGGPGGNSLIGQAGHVKFVPNSSADFLFAGRAGRLKRYTPRHVTGPMKFHSGYTRTPPTGTFYEFVNGRIVPVRELGREAAATGQTPTRPARPSHATAMRQTTTLSTRRRA